MPWQSRPWRLGALLIFGERRRTLKGAEPDTTNNRMELMGAIQGLNALRESCRVDIYTDSKYVQKGITEWLDGWKARGWRKADKKPVKNADLWQLLDTAQSRHQVKCMGKRA